MKKIIQFTKPRFIMLAVSLVLILGGIAGTVLRGGFNLGIDFSAGINLRVQVTPAAEADVDINEVRSALSGIAGTQVQVVGNPSEQQYSIKIQEREETDNFQQVMADRVENDMEEAFGDGSTVILENNYVGPSFSQDLARQSILLTTLGLSLILVYIWFRFKLGFALSAIAALVHDVLIMLGFIGTLQLEVSTATIAALLTIIGYSLNDTIVIFDRIRENETIMKEPSFAKVINASITQSLSRTLITSLTTFLAVFSIYIFAVGSIQTFALSLIVGVIVGTYSSMFVASPILLGWRNMQKRRARKHDMEIYGGKPKPVTAGGTKTPAPPAKGKSEIEKAAERAKEEIKARQQSSARGKGARKSRSKRKGK
ncbi:MAG: protein translocase subunit SecF [Spirochaetia bacterium]